MSLRTPISAHPLDSLSVIRRRRSLCGTALRLDEGSLTIGFLGGSITDGAVGSNWPEPVARWFATAFPNARIAVENAGMGATGSDSACFRAQAEIIDRGCSLTFVEYSVNDYAVESGRRARTREGLLRKLLAAGQEVVLVHTFRQEMYEDMAAGRMPASIAEFETLANHYSLNSIWVGLHALNEVRAGKMKWGEWLPDGLHPEYRGSWSYAEAVTGFLQEELAKPAAPVSAPALPAPLSPLNWEHAALLPIDEIEAEGPWILRRVHNHLHTGRVLETHTPGARLRFPFTGRVLALIFEYGRRSAEFTWRIDGGEWTPVNRERFLWGGDCGMVQPYIITEDLTSGPHIFELEVIHGNRPDCTGSEFRLGLAGVVQ